MLLPQRKIRLNLSKMYLGINMIKFEMQKEEAAFIVQVLGNLPTQSNSHPLWLKLVNQLQAQEQSQEVELN